VAHLQGLRYNPCAKGTHRSRIAEKLLRLPEYRKAVAENWLLIVNDRFLGAGEIYARAEHVEQWTFAFDFDKVLMFLREPGGTGEVLEVQREGAAQLRL
jgi:hypothetical protein